MTFQVPDAWAFLVLGETYTNEESQPKVTLIGWHAQCVTYEEQLTHFLGTTQVGSEHAEREALFWAAIWRLSRNTTVPTIFRSDSVTTAEQAMGRAGCNDDNPTFGALRSVFQALQAALPPDCVDAQHVRGHAGDPWNEMVDFLAKSEAAKSHNLKRQPVNLHEWKTVLPYMWMLFDKSAGLPSFKGHGFDVCPPQLPGPDAPQHFPPDTTQVARHHMAISLATCNVSSLYAGPEGFGGKLTYLRRQMCDLRLNFLGIQEARSTAGTYKADDVIRLASGCVKGQHGVELWINTKQPIAYRDNKPCFVQMSQVQVIHADHRRLLVRLMHPCIDCHLCVLHAPQSGRALSERRAWWEETQHILNQYVGDLSVYVFIDANAKTGPCCEPIVFTHDDSSSANTAFLIEFLKNFGLCLPSTTAIHRGHHGTWTAPDGLTHHRIDFIAIPQNEMCFCTQSCSIDHFETGNGHEDHQAVGVQLQWIQDRKIRPSTGRKTGRHDRNAIIAQEHVIDLAAIQTCAWNADIETQVQSLNQALHCTLQAACPRHKQGKKKQYLPAEIWEYRVAKLHLRRRLQTARRQSCRDSLRLVFWAWKHHDVEQDHTAQILHYHAVHANTVICSIFHLNCKYYRITRRLRRELQQSKSRQLSHALEQITEVTPASTLLQTMKPFIGPTNLKKQKKKGLPAVRKQDGSVCTTPEDAQNRWIEFFSHLEGGTRMDQATYRTIWRQNLAKFLVSDSLSISITERPSLAELEAAYRRVPSGKAVGNDGIPPELCHVKARDMARLTYAILIKVFVYGQEAIEHKGGRLAIAWKHRGDVRDCDTHRSLLVSSHMGKTIHRALRQKHHGLYTAYMQAQQLGGRPKIPVGIPLHLSRAFLRWQARLQRPTACIFLDLAEAFYRLIRPLALGGDLSDDDIAVIATRLGLGKDALHQFHAQLREPSALQQAGAGPIVQKFLQALHCDTWFQIGTQDDVVRTAIGSRPGDSYADVVFGFLWAQLLQRYEEQLVAHDVIDMIPAYDLPNLFDQAEPPHERVPFLGPTWMDDLNVCIAADTNAGVERKAGLAMSLLLDQCRHMHMEPNLRKGKTEIMFTFRGSQSREFRRKYFSIDQGLTVVGEHATVQVSVVSRYLHLGGILHHRDIDRVEVSRR